MIETIAAQFLLFFFARIVFALSGFGEGLVYLLGFHVCSLLLPDTCSGDLRSAVIFLTIESSFSLFAQMMILRKSINFQLVLCALPLGFFGTAIGAYILFSLDDPSLLIMKRICGVILLVVGLFKLHIELTKYSAQKDFKTLEKAFSMKGLSMKINTACTSLLSGIFNGLFSLPGPPYMVYVLTYRPEADMWRGSNAVIGLINQIPRVYIFLQSDSDGTPDLPIIIGLLCGSISGVLLGNFIMNHSEPTLLNRVILVLLLTGSVSIMSSELGWIFALCISISVILLTVLTVSLSLKNFDSLKSDYLLGGKRVSSFHSFDDVVNNPSQKGKNVNESYDELS